MHEMLFDVSPADPSTYLAVVVLVTAVVGAAGYLPARRAASTDPLPALEAD